MTNLTPTQYRKQLDNWRIANDHLTDAEIMPKLRHTYSPRHAKIADALKSLLSWRDIAEPAATLQTNFLQADNDNEPREEGEPPQLKLGLYCEHEIRPTVEEIMNAIEPVAFENGRPVKGDANVEYASKLEYAPISRIGGLRFNHTNSDQVGRYLSPHRGQLIEYVSGSRWFKVRDKPGTPKGARPSFKESNLFYGDLLGATPRRNVERLPVKQRKPRVETLAFPDLPPTSLSLARARAWCGLPPAAGKDKRPSLPWQPASARALFMSGRIACKPADETPPRNDPETLFENKEIAVAARSTASPSMMSAKDIQVIDSALKAGSLSDIGDLLGYCGKNAERHGKRAVLKAAENLSTFIAEVAA